MKDRLGSQSAVRILVLSDTHGAAFLARPVLAKLKTADYVLHCGDIGNDEEYLQETVRGLFGASCLIVKGNTDVLRNLPEEEELQIGKHRILVTHGHKQSISYGEEVLAAYAKEKGCDIVCCGHTHVPMVRKMENGVLLVNPGSLVLPRGMNPRKSCAILEVEPEGEAVGWIHFPD